MEISRSSFFSSNNASRADFFYRFFSSGLPEMMSVKCAEYLLCNCAFPLHRYLTSLIVEPDPERPLINVVHDVPHVQPTFIDLFRLIIAPTAEPNTVHPPLNTQVAIIARRSPTFCYFCFLILVFSHAFFNHGNILITPVFVVQK